MTSKAKSKASSRDRNSKSVDREVLIGAEDIAAKLDEAYFGVIGLAGAHDFPLEVIIHDGSPKVRLSDFNEHLENKESGPIMQGPSAGRMSKETITKRWFQAEIREAIFRNEARHAVHSLSQFALSIRPFKDDGSTDMALVLLQAQAQGIAAQSHATIEATDRPPRELDAASRGKTPGEARSKKAR